MALTKIIPISQVSEFKTGDILQTTSVVPFVRHYAIIFYKDNIGYVADNSFTDGCIRIFTLSQYQEDQDIVGIIRTPNTLNITDELIEQKISEHKPKGYRFFTFNCENFIRDICGCQFGLDQRIVYLGIIPAIIILSGIAGYFTFRDKKIGGGFGAVLTIAIVILAGIIGQKIVKHLRDTCPDGQLRMFSNGSCEIPLKPIT